MQPPRSGLLETMIQNAIYNSKTFCENVDELIEKNMTPIIKRASKGTTGILRKGTNDLMRTELTPKSIDMEGIVNQALSIVRYDPNAVERIMRVPYYDSNGGRRRNNSRRYKQIELASDGQSIVEYSTSTSAKIVNGRRVTKTQFQMGVRLNYNPWSMWINAENDIIREIVCVESTTNKAFRVNVPVSRYERTNFSRSLSSYSTVY
jgi:hypothetical protein